MEYCSSSNLIPGSTSSSIIGLPSLLVAGSEYAINTRLFSSRKKSSIIGPRSCRKAPFLIQGLISHTSSGSSSVKIFCNSTSNDKESYSAFLCKRSFAGTFVIEPDNSLLGLKADSSSLLSPISPFSSLIIFCSASFISSEISDFATSTSSPSRIVVSSLFSIS